MPGRRVAAPWGVTCATAVATTSGKHMRSVMESEFRPIVLSEVFRRSPGFIETGKAADVALSVGFRIGGRRDGDVERHVVHVRDGVCRIEADPPEGHLRDATITLEGADPLRLGAAPSGQGRPPAH